MRLLALVGLILAVTAPPAAALDGVTVGTWSGQLQADAVAGCNPDDQTVEDDDAASGTAFTTGAGAVAQGSCPDFETPDPNDTITITSSGEGGGSGSVTEADGSLHLAGALDVGHGIARSLAGSCCAAGQASAAGSHAITFTVTTTTAYSLDFESTGAEAPASGASNANAMVQLVRVAPSALQVARVITNTDQATTDPAATTASGELSPGDYMLQFSASSSTLGGALTQHGSSASSSAALTLGAQPPTVIVDQAPSGAGNPSSATIAFHASVPEVSYTCSLDDGPAYDCTSPQELSGLADGDHRFTIVATDGEGRESEPEVIEWRTGPFDCAEHEIVIGFARACGPSLEETEPGSGVYRTSDRTWIGGFEVVPRPGGVLVLDTGQRAVRQEGAGTEMVFAGRIVPFDASALPVGLAAADLDFNAAGTFERQLFSLPVKGTVKTAWIEEGRAASFEATLDVEQLTVGFAELEEGAMKLTAKLTNGSGFALTGAEAKAGGLKLAPRGLAIPRSITLNDLLARYALKDGKDLWEGGAGFTFPVAKGELSLSGRASLFDGSLAGAAIKVGGFNRPIPNTPLFLQSVEGGLQFTPSWGFNLGAEATVGPKVDDVDLVKGSVNLRGGSLAEGCTVAPDPVELAMTADLTPLKLAGVGSAKLSGTGCLYATSTAYMGNLKAEVELGDPEYPAMVAGAADLTGWISPNGLSYEGTATVRLPLLPEVAGRGILSTKGVGLCGELGVLSAGTVYEFGTGLVAFQGCDLSKWVAAATASAARASAAAATVRLPKGLPSAGFSGRGERLVLRGPRGERIVADRPRLSRSLVVVHIESEDRLYVFVRRPSAGRWRVEGTGVRWARGLPQPKVRVRVRKVKGKPARRRLVFEARRIAGQRIEFHEVADGVARRIGRPARRARGRFVFRPARVADRSHVVQALVTQDGLPRDVLVAGRFRAPR